MRRICVWLVAVLLIISAAQLPAGAAEKGFVPAQIDLQMPDEKPLVVGGVTMYAVDVVAERLNGTLSWEENHQKAVIETAYGNIAFTAGSNRAHVQDRLIIMTAPAAAERNSLYVPASFLLNFVDQNLSAVYHGPIDPVAIALLQQDAATIPQNLDLQVVGVGSLHALSPFPLSDQFMLEMKAQVRGKETLINYTMSLPDLLLPASNGVSGREAMPKTVHMSVAVRGGKTYLTAEEDPWRELSEGDTGFWDAALSGFQPPPKATPAEEAAAMASVYELLSSVHLGASRMVNGHTEQDIILELNTQKLDELTQEGIDAFAADTEGEMGSEEPMDTEDGTGIGDQMRLTWNVATFTITLDPKTGLPYRVDALFSARAEAKMVGRMMPMGTANVHLLMTFQPNAQPIRWPADLPK